MYSYLLSIFGLGLYVNVWDNVIMYMIKILSNQQNRAERAADTRRDPHTNSFAVVQQNILWIYINIEIVDYILPFFIL